MRNSFWVTTYYLLGCLLFFFLACGTPSAGKESDCTFGEANPIFKDTSAAIINHQFKKEEGKNEAVETINFKDSLELTITQRGCNELIQEFQFKRFGDYSGRNQQFWLQQAAKSFEDLSKIGPEYHAFYLWGQAIGENSNQMKLGEPYELAPGFEVKTTKITGTDYAILVVTLIGTR